MSFLNDITQAAPSESSAHPMDILHYPILALVYMFVASQQAAANFHTQKLQKGPTSCLCVRNV